MKKLILTIAIGLSLSLSSCKKESIKPVLKYDVELSTHFICENNISDSTFRVMMSKPSSMLLQQIYVNKCSGIFDTFTLNSGHFNNVKISQYDPIEDMYNLVWTGEISINQLDSSFVINETFGPNIDLIQFECNNLKSIKIQ